VSLSVYAVQLCARDHAHMHLPTPRPSPAHPYLCPSHPHNRHSQVPLLIRAPFKKASVGAHTSSLTELVDMHPTIQALAGLTPSTPTTLPPSLPQGTDLSPLFDNPALTMKNASMSQFPNCGLPGTECMACTGPRSFRTSIAAMGYSIRTDTWRYTTYGMGAPDGGNGACHTRPQPDPYGPRAFAGCPFTLAYSCRRGRLN